MPTQRGFVEALEIGRAGLAAAIVLHADGSRATYTISDLDADPERFNERLSKLGLLRDAMDRAEPVEIEFDPEGEASGVILRVRRLTRDALQRSRETREVTGIVAGVAVSIDNTIGPLGEKSDRCTLALSVGGSIERYVIEMQTPERGVAEAMVEMARAAQQTGSAIKLVYDLKQRTVFSVEAGSDLNVGGGEGDRFAGFVESIAHTPMTDIMLVWLTTAPPFALDGNVVELVAFAPIERSLLVLHGAPEYALLEAALRDCLRVEILASNGSDSEDGNTAPRRKLGTGAAATNVGRPIQLVRGVELMASLCSASRPVWIEVNRRALDVGPDSDSLAGLPSNDLRPRTIREMDLPYRAEWVGHACFNHGVYRFQLGTGAQFQLFVDCEPVCLHDDADGKTRFGHACLEGDHEVRVVFENWSCSKTFDLDVYRIR